MKKQRQIGLCLIILLWTTDAALAHRMNISRSVWDAWPQKNAVEMTIRLAPSDVQQILLSTSRDEPAPLRPTEARWRNQVKDQLGALMTASNAEEACRLQPLDIRLEHDVVFRFRWLCPSTLTRFSATFSWLEHLPHAHKHSVRARQAGTENPAILMTPQRSSHDWVLAASDAKAPSQTPPIRPDPAHKTAHAETDNFGSYLWIGVAHAALGWDHFLFLLALLLAFQSVGQCVRILTAYALAVCGALGLTAAGMVSITPAAVEVAVCATIVLVAMENLWLRNGRWRWIAAVLFGLIHGLSVAGFFVKGWPVEIRWNSWAAFGLGVLCAQLLFVSLLYPVVQRLRRTGNYRRYVLTPGSVGIATMGLVWCVIRSLAL